MVLKGLIADTYQIFVNDYGPSGIPGRINEFYTPAESNRPPK
jgi:hypothetical protein